MSYSCIFTDKPRGIIRYIRTSPDMWYLRFIILPDVEAARGKR